MRNQLYSSLFCCLAILLLGSCSANYVTPGSGVSVMEIADENIKELFEREPANSFPARLAVARIQDQGYVSKTTEGYGSGRYSIITTRDIETDDDFKILQELPFVTAVAPITRILAPPNANTIKDLRVPAARLKADMLLVYSVDTTFNIEGTSLGPLSLISLGFIPNKKAFVTSTVSGALIDVRTGYIYGTAEATKKEQQRATVWSTEQAIDNSRIVAEKKSFNQFITEFKQLWKNVTEQHVNES